MLDQKQIERLAAAAAALRPDWPIRSLQTFLTNDHTHRAYQDVAVALAWVATDPTSKTPKRMNEHGPWWVAAQAASGNTTGESITTPKCTVPGHTSYYAHNCGACRSEQLETVRLNQTDRTPTVPPERINQILGRNTP